MKSLDILHQRLNNQCLAETKLKTPAEVVEWLGAVQAQEYAMAKWGVGQRAQSVTDAVIEETFTQGKILRTHVLRPTWHFVSPADIRWMIELTAPRINAVNAYMYRMLELDDRIFRHSNSVLAKSLKGGRHLTRTEIKKVIESAGIANPPGMRLAYLLMRAELDGIICSGPRHGKQFTYALLEERAPEPRRRNRDETLSELIKRYFLSRGPATLKDFVWWSGLTMKDARHGVEISRSHLVTETWNGQDYWFGATSTIVHPKSLTAHLLPIYDEYPASYKDRSAAIDPQPAKSENSDIKVSFTHALELNGRIVGHWKRTSKKNSVLVQLFPFRPLTKAEYRAVEVAVNEYGAFLELPLTVA